MTRRGKRVSAERKECSGSPGESIFGGVKSRRFIAGVAEMNAWRRPVRAAGYCRASRTTAFYLHPAIVWERELAEYIFMPKMLLMFSILPRFHATSMAWRMARSTLEGVVLNAAATEG